MSRPRYRLREATAEDHDFLYRLHAVTMKDYVERTFGWDDTEAVARFQQRFLSPRYQIVVVDDGDVGAISVERRADTVFISNIHIFPEHQGRGLGTAIVQDILADARDGTLPVTLRVLKVIPARRLYERLGFRVTEETDTHFIMSTSGSTCKSV